MSWSVRETSAGVFDVVDGQGRVDYSVQADQPIAALLAAHEQGLETSARLIAALESSVATLEEQVSLLQQLNALRAKIVTRYRDTFGDLPTED